MMTNEEISLQTKMQLSKALKERMLSKGLDKVKISDLIQDCEITRSTFYYHFGDIPALLEWTIELEMLPLAQRIREIHTWRQGVALFMEALQMRKDFVSCIYYSTRRFVLEKVVYERVRKVIEKLVFNIPTSLKVDKVQREYIIDFYARAYMASVLHGLPEVCRWSRRKCWN